MAAPGFQFRGGWSLAAKICHIFLRQNFWRPFFWSSTEISWNFSIFAAKISDDHFFLVLSRKSWMLQCKKFGWSFFGGGWASCRGLNPPSPQPLTPPLQVTCRYPWPSNSFCKWVKCGENLESRPTENVVENYRLYCIVCLATVHHLLFIFILQNGDPFYPDTV